MQYKYNNLAERVQLVAQYEGQGLVMLHDDFDADWKPGDEPHGTLTFDNPKPKTPEQLHQEALDEEFNDKTHQGLLAYNNWAGLTIAQKDTILKNLLGFILYKEGML